MESIGRLAGGIAHDFNNILTSIMGFAELLKYRFNDHETREGRAVEAIFRGSERAAHLTKQLLGFARKGAFNPQTLNINNVINDTISVSEKIFEKTINIHYELEDELNYVEADKTQIEQVLTNLIINAKDAMPTGGDLYFKTENVFYDEYNKKMYPEFKPGSYAKISITDTGMGIPKDVRDHIFEPFFTTKDVGKGTGLGLATVYGIVKNHNGYIYVYSEPGEGSTFSIYLPSTTSKKLQQTVKSKIIKGAKTILIIDDEEDIRTMTKIQLEDIGYKVMTAENGVKGLEIYKKEKDNIDLVLLDMIMPEMDGKETFLNLKKINPKISVLLTSGFSQNGKAKEIMGKGILGFLQKPFKIHELSNVIHKALKK
jgi:CheY-like chemotaxis protein